MYDASPREDVRMVAVGRRPLRATTRRFVFVARTGAVLVPVRAEFADTVRRAVVFVAPRVVFVGRGTTRRGDDRGIVFTTVLIGLVDCDVVTPGFRFVRI